MDSRSIIEVLAEDGWRLKRVTGSNHHFMHPTTAGIVTVPHPQKDLPNGTLWSIEKQAGVKLR